MSCSQDSYYTSEKTMGSGTCGACGGSYGYCQTYGHSGSGQANCCPDGWHYSGNKTSCGDCEYGVFDTAGMMYKCLPDEPSMSNQSKLNCCMSQGLPNNDPRGYCATGWCPGTSSCTSFMSSYCQNNNLQTDACKQFCRSNPGKCDSALTSYCSNPNNYTVGVCGCALPTSQYILSTLKTPDGLEIPISCDQRCGVNQDAIRLQGQQDCKINAICVAELNDIQINQVKQDIGNDPAINVTQNCGGTPSGPNGPTPVGPTPAGSTTIINRVSNFIRTPVGIISLVVGLLFIILLLMLLIPSSKKKGGRQTTLSVKRQVRKLF